MAILNDNEFVEVDGRSYVNPQVALDESNAFIDNLRSTQQANNQEIQTQTYNLGSELPSQLGGLGSPSGDTSLSYFTSRYQVPQTNAVVSNLRATAQAAALNQALQNEQEKWKKRYNDAYRAYQKRAGSGGGGNNGDGDTEAGKGGITEIPTDLIGKGTLTIEQGDIEEGEDPRIVVDPATGNLIGEGFRGDNPRFILNEDGTTYTKVSTNSNTNSSYNYLPINGILENNAPLSDALRSRL